MASRRRRRAGRLELATPRRTRRVGRFEYRVILPEEVDADGIEANLSNGVLTVQVPKSERAQRRRIEVTSS
jgi:HSP20 family protein